MGIWNIARIADRLEELDIAIDREAISLARWIWEDILDQNPGSGCALNAEKRQKMKATFDRLLSGEPIQYIAGHAWFYGYKFKVNRDVLIPRPETEELAEWILEDCRKVDRNELRILDIGTGSGCIATVLKKYLGDRAKVVAIDISIEALSVAALNSRQLEAPVEFISRDFLSSGLDGLGVFDIIVSNPPYVSKSIVSRDVIQRLSYEPNTALYPIGPDPDIFYKKISLAGREALQTGGSCYLELNEFRAQQIQDYFQKSNWAEVEVRIDMQGMPRMLKAKKVDL